MTKLTTCLFLALAASTSACTGGIDDATQPPAPMVAGGTTGSETNTFNHDNDTIDPWELLQRLEQQGPPTFTARVHGCTKLPYVTLGNVLEQLGVTITGTGNGTTAADLYQGGYNALGGANYAARIRENSAITTSGASRWFDILASAAPQVIANIGSSTICPGVTMFSSDGMTCNADAVTCILGTPATQDHLDLCRLTIAHATDQPHGQQMAVAALLAAAHTCE